MCASDAVDPSLWKMVDVAGARAGGASLYIGKFIVCSYAVLVSCFSANADFLLLNCYSLLLEEKARALINPIPCLIQRTDCIMTRILVMTKIL